MSNLVSEGQLDVWLVRRDGAWVRPCASGLSNDIAEAGTFSAFLARRLTQANGEARAYRATDPMVSTQLSRLFDNADRLKEAVGTEGSTQMIMFRDMLQEALSRVSSSASAEERLEAVTAEIELLLKISGPTPGHASYGMRRHG